MLNLLPPRNITVRSMLTVCPIKKTMIGLYIRVKKEYNKLLHFREGWKTIRQTLKNTESPYID